VVVPKSRARPFHRRAQPATLPQIQPISEITMPQRLHLVFGGELVSTAGTTFKHPDKIDVIGVFPDYASAYNAWKSAAHRTVDEAQTRYFIAHIHRLLHEEQPASDTEELVG